MSHDDWQVAIAPKVQGTWNLHHELAAKDLDFFILFSSLSGLIGQIGQVNYAASNTFLDAFVQFRHGFGLPASVLDIGVMSDIGYISEKPSVLAQLRSVGMQTLEEQDLLDALHLAIVRSRPPPSAAHIINDRTNTERWVHGFSNPAQLAIGLKLNVRLNDPKNKTLWKRDARMSRYFSVEGSNPLPTAQISNASNEALVSFLTTLTTNTSGLDDEKESAEFLAGQIGKQLLNFMLLTDSAEEIDVGKAPSDLGVDSLVSIEIRNWWRQMFGFEINVLEILNAKSIRALGEMAATGLREKYLRREG